MAERSTAKLKRSDEPKTPRKPAVSADVSAANEVARLKAELAAAQARIAELESRQAEIVNRIDWVIDSLQTLANDA